MVTTTRRIFRRVRRLISQERKNSSEEHDFGIYETELAILAWRDAQFNNILSQLEKEFQSSNKNSLKNAYEERIGILTHWTPMEHDKLPLKNWMKRQYDVAESQCHNALNIMLKEIQHNDLSSEIDWNVMLKSRASDSLEERITLSPDLPLKQSVIENALSIHVPHSNTANVSNSFVSHPDFYVMNSLKYSSVVIFGYGLESKECCFASGLVAAMLKTARQKREGM